MRLQLGLTGAALLFALAWPRAGQAALVVAGPFEAPGQPAAWARAQGLRLVARGGLPRSVVVAVDSPLFAFRALAAGFPVLAVPLTACAPAVAASVSR